LPVPSVIHRNDDGRFAEFFLYATGDDTDHARMPAFARYQRDRAVVLRCHRGFGGLLHLCLDRPTFFVQPVKLLRDEARLGGIGRRQQAHAKIGFADAPAGIDARAERKAKVRASRRAVEPAAAASALSPILRRAAITFSPCATKARLRPFNCATSATVPSATISSRSISCGSSRSAK
jgi:hypothetical protein